MNPLALPTLVAAFCLFAWGKRLAPRFASPTASRWGWCIAMLSAGPALLFAIYYTKLLGEPLWLYRLRSVPASELLAAPAGLAAGWLQVRFVPRLKLSRTGSHLLIPVSLGLGLLLPHLKPVMRPLKTAELQDHWRDEVCLQSSGSTCGPAAAATLLHFFGQHASERELAQECYSSASGTENWFLARALRWRGLTVDFHHDETLAAPLPAIAGVKLKAAENARHFITLLRREENKFVMADPLEGRFTNTLPELRERYVFTGFLMSVRPREEPLP